MTIFTEMNFKFPPQNLIEQSAHKSLSTEIYLSNYEINEPLICDH